MTWLPTQNLSFNSLLLLERVQLSWFPGWLPEAELALALRAHPVVAWYMRHKCPEITGWLDQVETRDTPPLTLDAVYAAEQAVLRSIDDLLVYALDPFVYDVQPFLNWDSNELIGLVDFTGQVVVDIGAGTGRLGFVAAPLARAVYLVEPVSNLRDYMKVKARHAEYKHVYVVDGLITEIPFADGFADITLTGYVFGDQPEAECRELERVTRPGGMVILCPGNNDLDNLEHQVLVEHGYAWSRFEEPGDGWKRKYWKRR